VFIRVVNPNVLPQTFADPDHAALRDWISMAVFGIAGLIGAPLSDQTRPPGAWDPQKPLRVTAEISSQIGYWTNAFGDIIPTSV
jgi:hypothetical protein